MEPLNKSRVWDDGVPANISINALSRLSSFADLDYNHKKCRTRREVFLSEMEGVMPWPILLLRMSPITPGLGGGAVADGDFEACFASTVFCKK